MAEVETGVEAEPIRCGWEPVGHLTTKSDVFWRSTRMRLTEEEKERLLEYLDGFIFSPGDLHYG